MWAVSFLYVAQRASLETGGRTPQNTHYPTESIDC